MSIKGNTVGTIMPRTDYNQTDPTKPDYLVGKEKLDESIEKANETAAEVKRDAVLKSGSTMQGNINMNSFHITGLPTPTGDSDAISKSYMEKYITESFLGGEW